MSLSPVLSRPIDMVGSIILKSGFADESEVSALKAVSGYAKRDGLLGGIATLLHRVWNAFKAVFGQSDWQIARRAFISIADRGLSTFQGEKDDLVVIDRVRANLYTWYGYYEVNRLLTQFVELINEINEIVKPLGIFAESIPDRLNLIVDKDLIARNLQKDFLEAITYEIIPDNTDSIFNKLRATINEVQAEVRQTRLSEGFNQ